MSETITGNLALSFSAPGGSTISITTIPTSAGPGAIIAASGAWTGVAPSGITGIWTQNQGSVGAPVVSGSFQVVGSTWSAQFTAPNVAGNYTLTVTGAGPNTATSAPSSTVLTVITNNFQITSIPGTANTNTSVLVNGTFTGNTPITATALWNPGGIIGNVTNFITISGWSALVSTPLSPGTYTLTMTAGAPNGITSNPSGNVVVSAATSRALIAHAQVSGLASSPITTSAINTTGATILIAHVARGGGAGPFTPTDSKSNTWTALGLHSGGFGVVSQLFYAANPTVGSGHTFSLSGAGTGLAATLSIAAFDKTSTSSPLDVENGAWISNQSFTMSPGSISPSQNDVLIVCGEALDGPSSTASIGSGFATTDTPATVGPFDHYGGGLAWLSEAIAAPINPTWTFSAEGPASDSACSIAAFINTAVDSISVTTIPGTISTSKAGILVSGTYSNNRPTAMTAAWMGGANASLTGFSSSGGLWSATVTGPASAGATALTVTGTAGNTSVSPASSSATAQNEAFAITSMPGTGNQSAAIAVGGTFAGNIPTGMTSVWNAGAITGVVTNFTVTGPGAWTATVAAPSATGTYTLTATATGPNTTVSGASSAIVISAIAPTITLTSVPSFATTSTNAAIGFSYTGPAPTGLTAAWSPGPIAGTVSGFSASGGIGSANVLAPASAATYTLRITGTGPNTATSAASGNVSVNTPGSAVLVQSFSLTNWNASGTSSGFKRIGLPFRKGDVPSTASVQVKRGATIIDAQFDERTTWTDGSLKFAVCHLRDTTFTASELRNYDAYAVPTSSFSNTGTKTLADITGAHDFKVNFTNLSETILDGYAGWISGTTLHYGYAGNPPPINIGDAVTGPTNLVTPGTVVIAAAGDDGLGTWAWTINNSQNLGGFNENVRQPLLVGSGTLFTTVGSGTFAAHFNTHAGVATRVTKIHSGAVCEGWQIWGMSTDNTGGAEDGHIKTNWYVDIWKNSDGSIYSVEVAAVVAQDWFNGWSFGGKRRMYDAALVDGATNIVSYANVNHPYRTQWITCLNDGSHNRGSRPWVGGAMPTLNYKFDKIYWIKSKMIPPYDTTVSYVNTFSDPAGQQSANITYAPMSIFNHRKSIDGQGGYLGRGVLPDLDGFMLMLQRPQDYASSRINALAGLHIFYHYRVKDLRTRPGESADIANTPASFTMQRTPTSLAPYDFTADGMPTPTSASANTTGGFTPPGGEGAGFTYHTTLGPSHAVNFASAMYMVEGERYNLETQVDLATNLVHAYTSYTDNFLLDGAGWPPTQVYGNIPTNVSYNAMAGVPGEERANGFSINLMGYAAALMPDNHVAKNFMKRWLLQNATFFADSYNHYPADVQASGFMLGLDSDHTAGWQSAICGQCFINAYRMTEIAELKTYGFFKAVLTVNVVNAGTPLTISAYLMATHCRNYTQNIGTPGGYTTVPIMYDGGLFGNFYTAIDRVLAKFPFMWGEAATYPTKGYWPQNGDTIYSEDGNLRFGDVARPEMALNTPYYIVNVRAPSPLPPTVLSGAGTQVDFQISASPGGSPINFSGADGEYTFMGVPEEVKNVVDKGGEGTDIHGSWDFAQYPSFHMGVLVLASMEGCPQATPAVLHKQAVYVDQGSSRYADLIFSTFAIPP